MEDISLETRVKVLMNKHRFHFKKRLGQNFLIDARYLGDIVVGVDCEDVVLEIGPGMGFLTEAIAKEAGFVFAVEIDRDLVAILGEVFSDEENIVISHGDALDLDFSALKNAAAARGFHRPFKIIANLPYYITTPLLFYFLENREFWSDMTVMVQKEVAQRIVAAPGGKDYGVLTLSVAYDAEADIFFHLPASAFKPCPKVDSAVLHLKKREQPPEPVSERAKFTKLVQAAFAQRRKVLSNALTNGGLGLNREEVHRLLLAGNIDPQRRGETLSFGEFACLSNLWSAGTFREQKD